MSGAFTRRAGPRTRADRALHPRHSPGTSWQLPTFTLYEEGKEGRRLPRVKTDGSTDKVMIDRVRTAATARDALPAFAHPLPWVTPCRAAPERLGGLL